MVGMSSHRRWPEPSALLRQIALVIGSSDSDLPAKHMPSSISRFTSQVGRSAASIRKVNRQLRATLRRHVPLRSPVSICALHDGSVRNSSASFLSLRNETSCAAIGRHAFNADVRVKPLQAFMDKVAYLHQQRGACSLTLVNLKAEATAATERRRWCPSCSTR